jgi:RHS repeat-associated protein
VFGTGNGTACNVAYDELGGILSQPTPTGTRQYTYFVDGSVRTISDGVGNTAQYRYDAFGQVQQLDLTTQSADARQDRHFGAIFTKRLEAVGGPSVPTSVLLRKIPTFDGSVATRHGPAGPWTFEYGEPRGNRFFTDQTGAFVQDVDYEPFGKATSTGAQPSSQLYSNNQWNFGDSLRALGISRLGARLYDPAIGRFTSRDPLFIPRTATTTNPYAFASNDPVNSSDPTGLTEPDTTSHCGGADNPCPIGPGGGDGLTVLTPPTTPITPDQPPDAISGGSTIIPNDPPDAPIPWIASTSWTDPSSPEGSLAPMPSDILSSNGAGGGIGATLFGQVHTLPVSGSPYPVSPQHVVGPSVPERIIDSITDRLVDRATGVFEAIGAPYPRMVVEKFRPSIKYTVTVAVDFGLGALLAALIPGAGAAEGLAARSAVNASTIRFTQNSIGRTFKNGKTLRETIEGLKSGAILPENFPPIRVFARGGHTFTLDNRRLFVFQQAGMLIRTVRATAMEILAEAWKFTTTNEGTSIVVRGGL